MANFDKAFEKIIGVEGGYVDDKDDFGGETKYGISRRSYPDVDIKNLTVDGAKKIYKRDFWDVLKLDAIQNQTIAEEIFDTAVNCGVGTGAGIVQLAINLTNYPDPDITADGKMGPKTIEAINNHKSPKTLYKAMNGLQFMRYLRIVEGNPKQEKFIRSWLSRVFEDVV